MNPNYKNPQPSLAPHLWRRHGLTALRHRCGVVVYFHGVNATASRNECLRKLNQMPRPKKIRVEHLETL
jgi:hypothetical protein